MKPHDAAPIAASLDAVWPGEDWLETGLHDGFDAHQPGSVLARAGSGAPGIDHAGTGQVAGVNPVATDAAILTATPAATVSADGMRATLSLCDGALPFPALPRRIAMISDHASPLAAPGSIDCGGQNVYVANLARELARAGVAVDIFTRRDAPGQQPVVDWLDGVRVIHVPAGPPLHVPKEALLPHIDAFARFVARFARRQPVMYDLVHANFFMSGMVAAHLQRSLQLPFVITFHALGQVRRLAQGAADGFPAQRIAIETGLMREAGRVIAECPQDRLDMEQLYDAPSARIAVIPCGFSPAEFWPVPMCEARRHLRIASGRFVVLQLGRMVPRKGVDTVIQGVAMLRQRHGIDAELVVVGGEDSMPNGTVPSRHDARHAAIGQDGLELARLRQLARELGIAAHVRFEGRQPRTVLRDYYAATNVFASTPWYEPFGITPVEAMACARAVVGAGVGGIKNTVLDGVTGYLVPPRDPEALADRLAHLQRQPEHAQRMGQLGRVRACEHYTWQRVAQQVMAIYTEVLEETRAAHQPAFLSSQESA